MVIMRVRDKKYIYFYFCDSIAPKLVLSGSKRSSKTIFYLRTITFRKKLVSIELTFQKRREREFSFLTDNCGFIDNFFFVTISKVPLSMSIVVCPAGAA